MMSSTAKKRKHGATITSNGVASTPLSLPPREDDGTAAVALPAIRHAMKNGEEATSGDAPTCGLLNAKSWWNINDEGLTKQTEPGHGASGATALVRRCMRIHRWTLDYALRVLQAYRQYLHIKTRHQDWNGNLFVPSHPVDLMWQQHVLDTANYPADCMLLCGHAVNYDPELQVEDYSSSPRGTEQSRTRQRRERTATALRDSLGQDVDQRKCGVWSDVFHHKSERVFIGMREEGGEIKVFSMKPTVKVGHLFRAYAVRKGESETAFRFFSRGNPIIWKLDAP